MTEVLPVQPPKVHGTSVKDVRCTHAIQLGGVASNQFSPEKGWNCSLYYQIGVLCYDTKKGEEWIIPWNVIDRVRAK